MDEKIRDVQCPDTVEQLLTLHDRCPDTVEQLLSIQHDDDLLYVGVRNGVHTWMKTFALDDLSHDDEYDGDTDDEDGWS